MYVPPGGGPPPHRHDFEEMFTVLDGEIALTFRGVSAVATAGDTINVPANAPPTSSGTFRERPARLLCLCAPAGQEEFFKEVGVPLAHRTEAPPVLDDAATAAFIAKATALAPKYRTELLLDEPKPGPAPNVPRRGTRQPHLRRPHRAAAAPDPGHVDHVADCSRIMRQPRPPRVGSQTDAARREGGRCHRKP